MSPYPTSPQLAEDSASLVTRQLEALIAGQREAAAWLYDRFGASLYRRLVARYSGWPGFEAGDLLQDAFVFFFQKGGKVLKDFLERTHADERSPARLERHLWDLACGLVSNRRRAAGRAGRHESLDDATSGLPEPVAAEAVEESHVERDLLDKLRTCIEERGARLALYYRFRYADGFSPNEIATLTGWSMKATYKLKQALAEGLAACMERLGLGRAVLE